MFDDGALEGDGGEGQPWHSQAPSAELVELLAGAHPEHLSDFDTVEAVAAWGRVASWAQARQAEAAAELAERESMQLPVRLSVEAADTRLAAHELSLRLGTSRQAAARMVRMGRSFTREFAVTGEALETGAIDIGKATDVLEVLRGTRWDVAVGAQDVVLPRAHRLTRGQLRRALRQAIESFDPEAAQEQHAQAVRERYVSAPVAAPDGMAGLWVLLPAPDAVALHASLDATARAVRQGGDVRTLDQLRADTLYAAVVVPRRGDLVGEQGSVGDLGAARAPDLGLLDHLTSGAVPTLVRVAVRLDTLLGMDEEPGFLDGYGAVPATTARALAAGGMWQRLVTEPLSDAVLDVGRERYRPPASLAEYVRTRDGTCVSPTCNVPAQRCDLDHTVPHGSAGGSTSHANLAALSRACHVDKTHGGFELDQVRPGSFEWRTPTGHRYLHQPDPATGPGGVGWSLRMHRAQTNLQLEPLDDYQPEDYVEADDYGAGSGTRPGRDDPPHF